MMPDTSTADIPLLEGLRALARNYDAILCDVWGVIHNGRQAHPAALDAVRRYRDGGGCVLLFSNAPRSNIHARKSLEALGVGGDLYDGVVTSGDVTLEVLASGRLGRACFYLGPGRDRHFMEESKLNAVDENTAEFILCVGLRDDERDKVEEYLPLLRRMAARSIPMVCANPDIIVERGENLLPCAGALARLYESLGGDVRYFGKPHKDIYRHAWKILEDKTGGVLDKKRVLAIGDGIATDILGARDFGIDAVFVTGGIAALEVGDDARTPSPQRLRHFFEAHEVRPVAAMTHLFW
ncbi:MAG: TIGR01459 family HAD-type hydrolase [Hyphomicrobiales bacterium]|nr:TIGR01459 family HAD-type hydrolase [Hyphomicrobiales bacterium]